MATWTTRFTCPADSEQYMLIEDLYKQGRKITTKY